MSPISELSSHDFILQNIDVSRPSVGNEGKPIVLFIKAEYCGYCTNYIPTFETLSKQYKKIKFCFIEYTKNQSMFDIHWKSLAHAAYVVKGYPTLVLYDPEGNPIKVVEDRQNIQQDLKQLI